MTTPSTLADWATHDHTRGRTMIRRLIHRLMSPMIVADDITAGASWDDGWLLVHRRWHRPLRIRMTRRELVALGNALADSHLECCGTPQTTNPTRDGSTR